MIEDHGLRLANEPYRLRAPTKKAAKFDRPTRVSDMMRFTSAAPPRLRDWARLYVPPAPPLRSL